MVLGIISTILVPLPGYCTKGKTSQEKKPFKRDEIRGKLEEKHLVEVGKYFNEFKDLKNLSFTNKKYKELFNKYEFNPVICTSPWFKLVRFKNAITYRVYSNQECFLYSSGDFFAMNIKIVFFESGSFGKRRIFSLLKCKEIISDEKNWKKEIFPFEDEEISGASSSPAGFKIVITNRGNGEEIVFLFEFGNISRVTTRNEYSLEKERISYNTFLSGVRKFNVENPTEMSLKAIKISDVKKVVISFKIKNIAKSSFTCYDNLECVEVANDINSVKEYAFAYCEKLKRVIFKGKVLKIEDYAFVKCSSLEELQIPEGLVRIGFNCFKNCSSLKKIVIPQSTKEICLNAFEGTPSDLKISYFGREYNKDDFFKAFVAHSGIVKK